MPKLSEKKLEILKKAQDNTKEPLTSDEVKKLIGIKQDAKAKEYMAALKEINFDPFNKEESKESSPHYYTYRLFTTTGVSDLKVKFVKGSQVILEHE